MFSPFFNGFGDDFLTIFRFWIQTFLSCTVLQSDTKEINGKLDSCMRISYVAVKYVVLDVTELT